MMAVMVQKASVVAFSSLDSRTAFLRSDSLGRREESLEFAEYICGHNMCSLVDELLPA